MRKFLPYLSICALLLLSACKGDITNSDLNIDYSANVGLPIGKAKFNLADVINKVYKGDELQVDESSRYYIKLQQNAEFSMRDIELLPKGTQVSATDKFILADQLPFPIPPSGLTITPGTLTDAQRTLELRRTNFIDFSIQTTGNEERIDSAIIEHSELFIRLKKPDNIDIEIKKFKLLFPMRDEATGKEIFIEIPNATYPTEPAFNQDYNFTIDNFVAAVEQNPLDPTKGGFTFDVEIDAVINGGTIMPADIISYEVTYTIFNHKVVYGQFSPDPTIAKTRATINFDLIKDINRQKSGALLFDDLEVLLTLKNYDIGMNINLTLDTMYGIQQDQLYLGRKYARFDGVNYSLSKNFPTRPEYPFSNVPSILTLRLNKENGEIHKFFEPNFMADQFHLIFSVGGVGLNTSSNPMFITKAARIDCGVDFKIPLNLRPGSFYAYSDSIAGYAEAMNGSDGIFQYVDSALLRINLENGFPIGIKIKLQLYDESGNPIDSDLSSHEFVVDKAPTNRAGEVDKNTFTKGHFDINLSPQTISAMQRAHRLDYRIQARNDDMQDNICFKESNQFNISLHIFGGGKYKGNLKK